jgi:hypothetical protein
VHTQRIIGKCPLGSLGHTCAGINQQEGRHGVFSHNETEDTHLHLQRKTSLTLDWGIIMKFELEQQQKPALHRDCSNYFCGHGRRTSGGIVLPDDSLDSEKCQLPSSPMQQEPKVLSYDAGWKPTLPAPWTSGADGKTPVHGEK